jgi:hypothetical protein
MTVPNPLQLDELAFILLLSMPIIFWGYRNGLDAVMIAVVGTLGGMIFADTLAGGITSGINTFWRIGRGIMEFGSEGLSRSGEIPPLIETPEQVRLAGTIIFLLITFVAFRIAGKRAGGHSNIFEAIFGMIGGAVVGYIIVTFVIPRHLALPQRVEIVETQLPVINLDANVLVLIALVVIVFGVQGSKKKKK